MNRVSPDESDLDQFRKAASADLRRRMPAHVARVFDDVNAALHARMFASASPSSDPPARGAPSQTVSTRPPAARPMGPVGHWGFRDANEYLAAVVTSSKGGSKRVDPRLIANAPTTFGEESVGADGGFAIPPDFRTSIVEKVFGVASLLGLTDRQTTESNVITLPVDETTPWQTTGGVQAYWALEAEQMAQSKLTIAAKKLKLNKLITLIPITDELLQDSAALASYVTRKAPQKMDFKINDALINGTGVGMPLGILNSAGTIVIAKESGQAASTLVYNNIEKLWTAILPEARQGAIWMIHPDLEQQIMTLAFPGSGTTIPAYQPPAGIAAAPFGTLMGRPIFPTQAAQLPGVQGDIIFGDPANYVSATKTGGVKSDVSIHVWFDYDITAFRFVMRVGGQPWWNSPVQPYDNGSTTRGFFATLAAR